MKYLYLVAILALCFISCQNKNSDSLPENKKQELKKYLSDNNVYNSQGNQIYVLLHPDFCGSCTLKIQEFVKKEFSNCDDMDKTLVLSSDKEEVSQRFTNIKNLNLLTDEENELQRYDLANGLELFLVEKDGVHIKSGFINLSQIEAGMTICP